MTPVEKVVAYHERTKHHFERFAASSGYLDWANQPDPFRRFEGAPLVRLVLHSIPTTPLPPRERGRGEGSSDEPPAFPPDSGPPYDDLFADGAIAPAPVNAATVSALLQYSLALSAWKQSQNSKWALRINPSSGNLHPTEGYVIVGAVEGLHDLPGVYHYAPREHGLEHRTEFSTETWKRLTAGFSAGTFFVGLTSIHWREAWKYGERAYRYCQHDVGHAMAAIAFSAATLGWQVRTLEGLSDNTLASVLGLNRDADFRLDESGDAASDGAERECPDLLMAIYPRDADVDGAASVPTTLPVDVVAAIAADRWSGRANRLSRDHVDWPIIEAVSIACEKGCVLTIGELLDPTSHSEAAPFASPLAQGGLRGNFSGDARLRSLLPARRIILQRRSAVSMDGRTSISADTFFLMLDRTVPRQNVTPWHALGAPACVHLLLFVHRVDGVTPGLYFFIRTPEALDSLRAATDPEFAWTRPPEFPEDLPLYFLKKGDARRVAGQVSCGQDIAADGAFAVGMIAEFAPRLREFGPWFYRRLFWETGMIGQVLYLEAEAAGVRATGIGCFFDDPVHSLLGLRNNDYQSLYHFTVGGATEDLRLMTWPAYEESSE